MPEEIKKRIKIIQQVRKEDFQKVQDKYLQNKIECELNVFFENIFIKFSSAHLVITRAGGSTVAEIITSKKPAILVPYPNSLDNHQTENSQIIKGNGGWIFEENKNKINELNKLIDSILKNPKKLIEANQKLNKFSKKLDGFLNYKTPTVFLTDLLMERNLINKKGVTKAC